MGIIDRQARKARAEKQRQVISVAIEQSPHDCADISRLMGRRPGFLARYVATGIPANFQPDELAILSYALGRNVSVGSDTVSLHDDCALFLKENAAIERMYGDQWDCPKEAFTGA